MTYDVEEFNNNPDVMAGERCILLRDKNGHFNILPKGDKIGVGDTITIHRTNTGDLVTHGKSRIGIGDKVIIVPLKDGDLAALSPGINPWRDCIIIPKTTFPKGEEHDPPDETMQHHSYSIELSRALDPFELANARFDFSIGCDDRGVQPWYKCGGVWIGLGAENTNGDPSTGTWYWPAGDPYRTIRGQPVCSLDGSTACMVGVQSNDYQTWCIQDFMHSLYPYGIASWPVKWIHIHISQQSSLFFYNYTKSRLTQATICAGGDVRSGWCEGEVTGNVLD